MIFKHKGVEYHVDDEIHCAQVIGDPYHLILTKDFNCLGDVIRAGFRWDGASSPAVPIARFVAPKFYKNIVASCWHDFRCSDAGCKESRKIADHGYYLLKKYVELDNSVTCNLSYIGVRIGAALGIGVNKKDRQ